MILPGEGRVLAQSPSLMSPPFPLFPSPSLPLSLPSPLPPSPSPSLSQCSSPCLCPPLCGRWGHSGYKEVYAEEFASSESEDSEKEVKRRHKHSKTVMRTNGRVKKVKKSRSELSGSDGTHHSTRKRRRESSSSDEESSVRLKHKTKRRGVREERRKDKKKRDKDRHKSHTSDKPKRKHSTTDTD